MGDGEKRQGRQSYIQGINNQHSIYALKWTQSLGGVDALVQKSQSNLKAIEDFVAENTDWIGFLAKDKSQRSSTSVCLTIDLPAPDLKKMVALLESEHVAYDIGGYRDAPPSIRIWCGSTVEEEDVKLLMPWLKWAYLKFKN